MSRVDAADSTKLGPGQRRVVFATVFGTALEWYDFYLFVVLAPAVGAQFFAPLDAGVRTLVTLLAFVAAFAVRPIGALIFGAIADRIGRKRVFVYTVLAMGGSTCAVGLMPGWEMLGVAAPLLLVALRMLQGLAIGGEYGAAASYMAEHAPAGARGRYTAWLQTTATLGLLAALLVEQGLRAVLGDRGFADWGWRIPFLMSVLLLPLSIWVRLRLPESPRFEALRAGERLSASPLREVLGVATRRRVLLVALFGVTAGQAVLWYTGQLYALSFLQTAAGVEAADAQAMMTVALAFALPTFLVFGALSDRIGRRPLVIGGCLLAAALYVPIFDALIAAANPAHGEAQRRAPIRLLADAAQCRLQFDPVGVTAPATVCDQVRRQLAQQGLSYAREALPEGAPLQLIIGDRELTLSGPVQRETEAAVRRQIDRLLEEAGYPTQADPARIDRGQVTALLWLLVVLAGIVYAPVAALLTELFPTRIRCTAIALPYHLGNGWFGGFLPAIAAASVAARGEALAGLGYPIAVALATALIALIALPETRGRDLDRID